MKKLAVLTSSVLILGGVYAIRHYTQQVQAHHDQNTICEIDGSTSVCYSTPGTPHEPDPEPQPVVEEPVAEPASTETTESSPSCE